MSCHCEPGTICTVNHFMVLIAYASANFFLNIQLPNVVMNSWRNDGWYFLFPHMISPNDGKSSTSLVLQTNRILCSFCVEDKYLRWNYQDVEALGCSF